MYTVLQLPEFEKWLVSVKDSQTRLRLARRLKRVAKGVLGDVEPVGEGVSEMREDFGAGWRMYFVQRRGTIIMMLGGGTKATQSRDIKRAKKLAATLET
ncbi:MAG: type II toxin-antitoxin system RelE/ParE family toxin [Methylobacillus sp.]|jgi:putative addiction module killer protein|nr:type II toxin-antitoxin system RelE/ParE family toxin [Methylobacillus sp.]